MWFTFVVYNRFLLDSIMPECVYSEDAQTLMVETNRNKCYKVGTGRQGTPKSDQQLPMPVSSEFHQICTVISKSPALSLSLLCPNTDAAPPCPLYEAKPPPKPTGFPASPPPASKPSFLHPCFPISRSLL